jgi:hypothetical protein
VIGLFLIAHRCRSMSLLITQIRFGEVARLAVGIDARASGLSAEPGENLSGSEPNFPDSFRFFVFCSFSERAPPRGWDSGGTRVGLGGYLFFYDIDFGFHGLVVTIVTIREGVTKRRALGGEREGGAAR